jgi:hypothetical protein
MSGTEFFSYLLGRDTSRELAEQLVDVYRIRTRRQPAGAATSDVVRR